MKCCNQNDILFTPLYDESFVRKFIGMEGYFANSDKELMRKIQDDSFISKVKNTVIDAPSDFDWCPLYYTEVISDVDNSPYCIFLPKDKVFEFNQFMVSTAFKERFKLVKYLI